MAPKLGHWVDKIYPGVVIAVSSVLGAITTYFLIQITHFWMFALLWIIDNTIVQMAFLAIQNLLSRATLKHRGKIMGITSLSESLGQIIGPIFGGLAWDQIRPQTPFLISIFVELSLIPIYWIAVKYIIPHLAEQKESEKKAPSSLLSDEDDLVNTQINKE